MIPDALAGPEFVVNTRLDTLQRAPRVAGDGSGAYAVVWVSRDHAARGSRDDIILQRFSAADVGTGAEFLVNTHTAGDQDRPAIAMNTAGDMVVVWASYIDADSMYDIRGRLFRAGQPSGDEFAVTTTRLHTQNNPDVTMDEAGSFVVAWDSWFQDGSDRGVYGRRFSADGTPLEDEFRISETTSYSQARPVVRMRPSGGFLTLWDSWRQDIPGSAGYGVYGRIWSADGAPLTGEFPVNTTTADYQWQADASVFGDGSFAAVWCSWEQDGSDGAVVAQLFDPDGQKAGGEITVNRSTAEYQWLPRVRARPAGGFVVVWSSWNQDGSREGVYGRLFDGDGRGLTQETRLNEYAENFQWEPDLLATGPEEVFAVWSSWGQTGNDYDIVARRLAMPLLQGTLSPAGLGHETGHSTARVGVHVTDSLLLTGHTYDLFYDSTGARSGVLNLRNTATGDTIVRKFPVDRGEGVVYATPPAEGFSVEFHPEFDLELDLDGSYFRNRSGSTLLCTFTLPTAGMRLVAPIDAALVWGPADTLAGGWFVSPSDTALATNGQRTVAVPFYGVNLTDGERLTMLVVESRLNQRWDPGEKIIFLTPLQYRQAANNTHAEIATSLPPGMPQLPAPGDTCIVLTTRPLRNGERYSIVSTRSLVLDAEGLDGVPEGFLLYQNYPNPFNPTTLVEYVVPFRQKVTVRVYTLLGQNVATVAGGVHGPGRYRVRFGGTDLAAGMYFVRLEAEGGTMLTRKMVLVK